MNRNDFESVVLFGTAIALVLGMIMSFITMWYLNHSKRRARLFDLGYSKESDWYKGEKVDIFTANLFVANMGTLAYFMKRGWAHKRSMAGGIAVAPNLHINKNYEKFLAEFPFFVRWETGKFITLLIGCIGMLVFWGMGHGWW